MSDLLIYLAVMNLFAGAAVGVVMALRLPVRRLFGPRVAYALWALAPLPALALLLPARVVRVDAPLPAPVELIEPAMAATPPAAFATALPDASQLPGLIVLAWAVGCLASLAWFAWRQHQFDRAVRDGRAGPAVIGVLRPRIVTPDDFDGLYTDRERQVVLAHERTHIARHDIHVNALVALARCLLWFNPAVHVLAHFLRIDQELACDAQVIAAHPQARRSYAEAMLKTQLAARPLPLGCYWLAEGAHPLADRIRLLARPDPGRARRRLGTSVVALLALGAVGAAWAAKPARVVAVPAVSVRPPPVVLQAPAARVAPFQAAALAPKPAPAAAAAPVSNQRPAPAPQPSPDDVVATAEADAAPVQAAFREPDAERLALAEAPGAAAWARSAEARAAVRAAASVRERISSGTAVRVLASTVAPDGLTLSNDITTYGSNPSYRSGSYRRGGSAYGLYTSVYQHGERVWVTATVKGRDAPVASGSVALASGESGQIRLSDGQVVSVTATQRAETPEETFAAQTAPRPAVYSAERRAYRSRAAREE
jgi:beta-lactamase regulating signal transducer with metallopeptidase domain